MYEYATIYDSEKIEIVVKDGNRLIDRIDIKPMLNPISALPDQRVKLFEFVTP